MTGFTDIERSYVERGFTCIAGVDEAGRGPLAGPVVAAAVIFPPSIEIPNIDDSKKLTQGERTALFDAVHAHATSIGIGIVEPETIDTMNILQASIHAMHRAIDRLAISPDILLVDGNRFHHTGVPFETVVKGDARCFSIAAASIIAKVTRDRLMIEYDRTFPQYGFARHKGYPTPQHIEALRRFGPSAIHRRSFVVKNLVQERLHFA